MTREAKLSTASRPVERRLSLLSKKSISSRVPEVHIPSKSTKKLCSGLKYAVAWVAYVLVGSWVFLVLEETTTTIDVEHETWTRFKELARSGEVAEELHRLRSELSAICSQQNLNSTFDDFFSGSFSNDSVKKNSMLSEDYAQEWFAEMELLCSSSFFSSRQVVETSDLSMVDAIYYTMTLVTTIGFGHISPTTDIGKLFCIPYALVGVPLTCILMAKSSDMLSNRMLNFYETIRKRHRNHPKMALGFVTWFFLIAGCFLFMFLPSVIFVRTEKWSYIDAFYFSFITLSTIGFGDFIAGYGDNDPYMEAYKVLIVVWIMIALGYWIFLLNFLQKAIKSNAKTLKKTFQTKNISRQAEFLKQLITKMRQQEENETADDYDDRLHMMTLLVESLSGSTSNLKVTKSNASFHSHRTGLSKASLSRSAVSEPHLPYNQSEEEVNVNMEDEKQKSLSNFFPVHFEDLMRVKVSVKTETLPGFENLVARSGSMDRAMISGTSKEDSHASSKPLKEVTLPLKDVLSIVLLAASIDDETNLKGPETMSECSVSSSFAGAIIDPRESVPLLRQILVPNREDKTPNGLNLHDKENIQQAYLKSALSNYLDDCETHIVEGLEVLGDEDDRLVKKKKSLIV